MLIRVGLSSSLSIFSMSLFFMLSFRNRAIFIL